MKTNKHQTLRFIKGKEKVRAKDINEQFNYSQGTARSYLSYLAKQGLLERTAIGYILSDKGINRLHYFETIGCDNPDCPLCESKKAKHFTCPRCGYQLPKKEARISPEFDFIIGVKHAGVYCPGCLKLIYREQQAVLKGIPREAR
ncbi:MAG: DeoR family transcriptional regulator [Candidatus Sulfobium sp.]